MVLDIKGLSQSDRAKRLSIGFGKPSHIDDEVVVTLTLDAWDSGDPQDVNSFAAELLRRVTKQVKAHVRKNPGWGILGGGASTAVQDFCQDTVLAILSLEKVPNHAEVLFGQYVHRRCLDAAGKLYAKKHSAGSSLDDAESGDFEAYAEESDPVEPSAESKSPEDFLIEIERAFSRSPQIDYLGGRILLHDPADLPTSIQTLDTMVALPARAFVPSGFIHGANFAMSRQLIERLDGFDNRLGAGAELIAGEDTDMLVRASASGATGRYVPDVVVEHHHRRQRVEEFQQMNRGYAIGRGAYLAKALLDSTAFDYALKKEYLRQWYWSACKKWGTPKRGEIAHEIYGAAKYIKLAITQGRHVST